MTIQIGFLLFPRIQQLDLTGPYEMLAGVPGAVMHLAAKTMDPVQSVTGLTLQPTTTLDGCPALDVICIPGGAGVNPLLQDAAVLAFVHRQAAQARYVTSVCTGALILGAAGLRFKAGAPPPIGRRMTCWPASAPFPHRAGSSGMATCSPAAGSRRGSISASPSPRSLPARRRPRRSNSC
jgi:putative intracellular protease/amidase